MQTKSLLESQLSEDATGPRSILEIAPVRLASLIGRVDRDLLFMPIDELERQVKPDAFTNRVRLGFWREYERAQAFGVRMVLENIAVTIGATSAHVWACVEDTSRRLPWILQPPASYESFLDEALEKGLSRLRALIDAEIGHADPTSGRLVITDHKGAELMLKAVAFLDMRKHGGIVQKSINVTHDTGQMKKWANQDRLEEINKRIAEIEGSGVKVDEIGVDEIRVGEIRVGEIKVGEIKVDERL